MIWKILMIILFVNIAISTGVVIYKCGKGTPRVYNMLDISEMVLMTIISLMLTGHVLGFY